MSKRITNKYVWMRSSIKFGELGYIINIKKDTEGFNVVISFYVKLQKEIYHAMVWLETYLGNRLMQYTISPKLKGS